MGETNPELTLRAIVYLREGSKKDLSDSMYRTLRYLIDAGEDWIKTLDAGEIWNSIDNTDAGEPVKITKRGESDGPRPVVEILHDYSNQETHPGRESAVNRTEKFDPGRFVVTAAPDIVHTHADAHEIIDLVKDLPVELCLVDHSIVIENGGWRTGDALLTLADLTDPRGDEIRVEPQNEDYGLDGGVNDMGTVHVDYPGGRPPLGFDVEGDELVSNDEYHTIRTVLQSVRDNRQSIRRAAKRLDVSSCTSAVKRRCYLF